MIQLEVGKRYVLRSGWVTPPIEADSMHTYFRVALIGDRQLSWTVNGRFIDDANLSENDVLGEYSQGFQWHTLKDYDHLGDLQREHNEMQNKQAMQGELFTAVVKVGDRFHFVGRREAVAAQAPTSEPAIRTFASGATRNLDHNKLDYEGFNCPAAQRAFAEYMHTHRKQADGTIRDGDNWQKGIPIDQYAKSLIRHAHDLHLLHDGWDLQRPEDGIDLLPTTDNKIELLCAIWFNVQGMIHELLKEERKP